MIHQLEHGNSTIAAAILDVQLPAYRIEAELLGFDGIPALRDTVADIMACNETFVGYRDGENLLGLIAYEKSGPELDICRLVVHPSAFRRGIATKLLEHVLEREAPDRATVSTGKENGPAIALYKRFGFTEKREIEVAPGFFISSLVREMK
ncbi:GNAT family N-acetyltransferase [Paenibacillus agaridevorans]|uniref:GNAT family N-acetyltransferase n=1 Tax=Paenibacillus agaridevorans TaxID=171404 RepID=UPI001BE3E6B2|nr:N-acetyltransferase [Paenibacillus agaridevorans]